MSMPPALLIIYEQFTASVCTQLGEEAFQAALAEGRGMTAEQALTAQGPVARPEPRSNTPTETPARTLSSPPTSPDGLTPRERDVLRLLAQGLTSAQIAEQLVIGQVTVNSHVRSIYSKLGVTSRAAATRYALEHHLL
jgi:DNA-binding NarL/FixJ family response regulator